jgi:hypothetical protein
VRAGERAVKRAVFVANEEEKVGDDWNKKNAMK